MDAIKGNKVIYLFRKKSEAATKAAYVIAFTSDNSLNISKDADTVVTKDGTLRVPSETDITVSVTALLKKGDATLSTIKKAMLDDELMEIWRANLEEAGTGANKFKGTYYQGYVTSYDESSTADGYAEVTLEFAINGEGADGDVTVTAQQQEEAMYAFADTVVSA